MKGCRSFSDTEIESIKTHLNNTRDYTIFVCGLRFGFRISELLSLRVKDVFQYGKVTKYATVTRANMKGSKQSRTVVIHPEATLNILKLINEYSLEHQDYLFQSREGNNSPISYRQAWNILKSAYRACELQGNTGSHSMRKSFCKRVYEASGKDLLVTQRAMGHVSLSSTQSYLDCDAEVVDKLVANLK